MLGGIVVVAGTVTVSGRARRDALRHQRVELLVQQVRTASAEIDALNWRGMAQAKAHGPAVDPALLAQGFAVWRGLSATLAELRRRDHEGRTLRLQQDAGRLYDSGLRALHSVPVQGVGTTPAVERIFAPALAAIDRDSQRAVAEQSTIARAAARRAATANISSLIAGMVVLALLGWQLHRMRGKAMLAEERRALERRGEERLRALVEHSSDAVTVVGEDLSVRWQSTSVQRLLGHESAILLGAAVTDLVHPGDIALVEGRLRTSGTFLARFRHADGGWRHLETIADNRLADPAVEGIVLSMRDVSERKALEDELRHQAFHDALTGLANRALFEDRLTQALAGSRRHGGRVAVLFLDLDDFKTINDSLGHARGDELLRAVAARISLVVRPTDTAARLGGDEFAVLVELDNEERGADRIARRLLESLANPVVLGGRELLISASIGVATSDGVVGSDELLRNADAAMYAAKEAGKSRIESFEDSMHRRAVDRLELTAQLQRALDNDEFELDYQPIVALDDGTIAGVEALVRWRHPERGRLAPDQFIGIAEETGAIVALGEWILRTACRQTRAWHERYPGQPVQVSVNVSTRQLRDPDFPRVVAESLARTGLDPGLLLLEITEGVLVGDPAHVAAWLGQLKRLGVRVAIDDFGTGYSALSRLQSLPIDVLKIDRSFIEGMTTDRGKAQLVRGIINLGESLHLEIVAEGIEERAQADQLSALGTRLGQGFFFAPPMPAAEIEWLLSAREPTWLTRSLG